MDTLIFQQRKEREIQQARRKFEINNAKLITKINKERDAVAGDKRREKKLHDKLLLGVEKGPNIPAVVPEKRRKGRVRRLHLQDPRLMLMLSFTYMLYS